MICRRRCAAFRRIAAAQQRRSMRSGACRHNTPTACYLRSLFGACKNLAAVAKSPGDSLPVGLLAASARLHLS